MLRLGVIGLDSSHAPELVRFFETGGGAAVGRVTVAWPGGSADAPLSIERVEGFTAEVRDRHGVKILVTPEAVAEASDAVLLLAMDGRAHAWLFETIASHGRPVFVNKPLAITRADAEFMATTATKHGVRWFSASALRAAVARDAQARSLHVTCPLWFEPANAGWFWYGVHGVEIQSAVFGGGIATVSVAVYPDREILTARWHDGRVGVVEGGYDRALPFAVSLDGAPRRTLTPGMEPLAQEIARFVAGAPAPVSAADMIEVVRCLEAANLSRSTGGAEVAL